jgi:hypothetical protein
LKKPCSGSRKQGSSIPQNQSSSKDLSRINSSREYIDEARNNSAFDQDKVDSLSKEFDDTMKFALKTFSCRRAIGLPDDKTKRPSVHDSIYSEEDSLNFLETEELGNKQIGPVIPDAARAGLARTLEKLGGLWEQKRHNRVSVIQSWRLNRLNERLKITKRHNLANIRILSLFKKPLFNFYRILAFSKGMNLDVDYAHLPRVNYFDSKSQHAEEKMNDSSLIFNPSEIVESGGEQRLLEEINSRSLLIED